MRKMHTLLRFAATLRPIVCLLVVLAAATALRAQVAGSASIQGTITDSTGAFIPNAAVTLTDTATQVKLSTKSDDSGVYVFPNVDIAKYSLSVSVPGFKAYTQTGIVLEIGSSIAVNVQMTVGSTGEKVDVTAEGLALQTEDVSFKQTIDEKTVTEMPLNGRLLTSLLLLSGGSTSAPCGDCTGTKFPYQSNTYAVAGGGGNTTLWRLDGGDSNDYQSGANLDLPFPDAISQFSVESTALGASGGMHSGGLVNIVTKSGTNQYHGSGFEFIRNNFIDGTNFFSTSKDTLHENQYGGTFGGPIIRNKLFAFAAYQREKDASTAANTTAYVPTAANLAGDWSNTDPAPTPLGTGIANNCGKVQQLYDPLTGAAIPGNKYAAPPAYNPAAVALQKYLPAINPAIDVYGCGFVSYIIPSQHADNQFITRVDYTINAKNNFYGRYFIDGYQAPAFYSPTNILITTQAGNSERQQSLTFGENWTINSNTVNSAHLTGVRVRNDRGYNSGDINANIVGVTDPQLLAHGLQLSVGTSGKNHGFSMGGGSNALAVINDNTFSGSDDLTLVRGKHQIVIGGEYVQNELNLNNGYEGNGIFSFNGAYSGSGPAGGTTVGDGNLDYLWGSMNSFQQSKAQQNANRGPIPSLYIQDTWHASKRLTIEGGLRWAPFFYPADYFNRGAVFNYTSFLANQVSSVYPNAPAGVFYYGDPGVPKAYTQNSPNQFDPNLGLTFDPFGNGKWVIRAGAEEVYEQPDVYVGQRVQQNAPFATATGPNTSAQICFSNPWLVGGTGYGCNQVGGSNTSPFPQPQVPTKAQAVFPAQSQYIVMPAKFHPQDTFQYTASIQHEFSHDWQVSINYIGSLTEHTLIGLPLSPAVYIPGVWGAGNTGCTGITETGPASVFTLFPTSTTAGKACSTTGNQQSRFALTIANPAQGNQFIGGGNGSVQETNSGYDNYNGMIASVQHRLSTNFSLLTNYTWSKCLNIVDAQGDISGTQVENPANPKLDYGRCGSDVRNIFNTSVVVSSRFYSLHGLTALLVNNWEFAPLFHITSGTPINVTAGSDISLTDTGNDRASLVPGMNPYHHVPIRSGAASYATRAYLTQGAFVTAAAGSFGTLGRNAYSGPMAFQFDAQVSRVFPVRDRLKVDLRLEAFNVLNHPSFSNPSSSGPTGGSFGEISNTTIGARIFQGGVKLSF